MVWLHLIKKLVQPADEKAELSINVRLAVLSMFVARGCQSLIIRGLTLILKGVGKDEAIKFFCDTYASARTPGGCGGVRSNLLFGIQNNIRVSRFSPRFPF
jgi:hypothetical protein